MYKQHVLKLFVIFISLSCHAMYMYDLPELTFSKKVTRAFQHINKRHRKIPRINTIVPSDSMFSRLCSKQQEPLISPMPSTYVNTDHSLPFEPKDDIVFPGDFSVSLIDNQTLKTLKLKFKEILKEPIEGCIETIHENAQRLVNIKNRFFGHHVNQDEQVKDINHMVNTDMHNNLDPVVRPDNQDHSLKQVNPESSCPKPHAHHQPITSHSNHISKRASTDKNPDERVENNFSKVKISKKQKILVAAAISASLIYVWKQIHNKKTDEELLSDFKNTFNNEGYADDHKKKCLEQVIHRLIDPGKGIPLELLKSVLNQYNKVLLVKEGLLDRITSKSLSAMLDQCKKEKGATCPEYQQLRGYTEYYGTAYAAILSRAIFTYDRKAVKLLLLHLANNSPDGTLLRPHHQFNDPILGALVHKPDNKQKKQCAKTILKYLPPANNLQNIFQDIFRRGVTYTKKHVKLFIPFLRNSNDTHCFTCYIERHFNVDPQLYKKLVIMLLGFGKETYVWHFNKPELREHVQKEVTFRECFFNYNDENHYIKCNKLRERHPKTMGWWMLRMLQYRLEEQRFSGSEVDGMIDITMHDVKHIPQFCLDEMKRILSTPCTHDKKTKKEVVQWRDLFFFLDSKLPDAFVDKSQELGMLMLKIVEQGYYQKKSTYKSLRSILEYCLESDTLCPDISVQNGVEGSIIHLLSFFDNSTLEKIIATYRVKDPALLYYASSCIKPDRFEQEACTTPKDIAQNRLSMCNEIQEKEKITETIAILNQISKVDRNNLDDILRHIKESHQKKL